jgi:hypothetical protein
MRGGPGGHQRTGRRLWSEGGRVGLLGCWYEGQWSDGTGVNEGFECVRCAVGVTLILP